METAVMRRVPRMRLCYTKRRASCLLKTSGALRSRCLTESNKSLSLVGNSAGEIAFHKPALPSYQGSISFPISIQNPQTIPQLGMVFQGKYGMMCGLSNDKLLVFQPKGPASEWIARVQAQHPGLEIIYENSALPDGSIKPFEDLSLEVRDGVTLLSTYIPPPAQLLPDVKFIQLPSAGVDKWLDHATYKDEKVIFCTGNGCHPPQIAEWVIGGWLSFQHHFTRYHEQMKVGYWEPMFKSTVEDSAGARIGILGYGAIGRQCARAAQSMAMEVYAYTRSPRTTPESRKDDSYCVPGTGDPEGLIPAKWFHGSSTGDINDFLRQDLDILVMCLPLTTETHGIISHEQFEILSKKKTFISSVSRGESINTSALIAALEKGQIRGAAIDGADPEPLPSDHPLWKAPNLLITPHVSWQTHRTWERVLAILEINLEKLSMGQAPINRVNRELHY